MKKYTFYYLVIFLFTLFITSCDSSFIFNNGYIEDVEVFDESSSRTLQTGEIKYDQMLSLYNEDLTDHIYVRSESEEVDHLIKNGYVNQGFAFYVATSNRYDDNLMPLYRMYNQSSSDHIYTINVKEKEDLEGLGYVSQGIRGYVYGINDKGKTRQRIYRYYKGNKSDSDHIYSSQSEIDNTYMPQGHRWYDPFIVIFQDKRLEKIILKKIGKTSDIIFKCELLNIRDLELYAKDIDSLDGIEYCSNLKKIIIFNNRITNGYDLRPLGYLANLEELTIIMTGTMNIKQLTTLKKMKYLKLGYVKLINITFLAELKNLETIILINSGPFVYLNDFTPINELTNLNKLHISREKVDISQIVTVLKKITEFELTGCYIENFNLLSSLAKLKILSIYGCFNITDIWPLARLRNNLNSLDIRNLNLDLTYGTSNFAILQDLYNHGCSIFYKAGNFIN